MRYLLIVLLSLLLGIGGGLTSDLYAQDRDPAHIDQVDEDARGTPSSTWSSPVLPDRNALMPARLDLASYGRLYDALTFESNVDIMGNSTAPVRSGNAATLFQTGDDNRATVEQRGLGHTAMLTQVGNKNISSIGQYGRDHSADIRLIGNENVFSLEQYGSANRYELNFEQGTRAPLAHSVVQRGTGLSLSQTGMSTTGPATVVQEGNGMTVQIEHNP